MLTLAIGTIGASRKQLSSLKWLAKFFSTLPLYGRCSALIGLRRPDLGFCATGLRGIFIICYNLAYMMSVHKGRIS